LAEVFWFLELPENAGRPVYYFNIVFLPDHDLFERVADWVELTKHDLETINLVYDDNHPVIKQKGIIVVDECQQIYPTRTKGEPPQHCKFFQIHRHAGLDFFLITQKIRQIDIEVRGLVGDHKDYKRVLGRDLVRSKQLNRIMEGDDEKSPEILTENIKYPKHLFGLYKSSVLHTHKKRLPKKIVFGIPALLAFVGLCIYWGLSVLMGDRAPQAETTPSNPVHSANTLNPELPSGLDFSKNLFLSGEFKQGGNYVAFFDYVADPESKQVISFTSLQIVASGLTVKRISSDLYVVDGRFVRSRPVASYDPEYVCCNKREHREPKKDSDHLKLL
jgi:hypothetical protein